MRIPEDIIFKIFNQVITGLEWFHDKNIAHRDIKPENIIVNFKS
jgi:serine/threonine protein kinase